MFSLFIMKLDNNKIIVLLTFTCRISSPAMSFLIFKYGKINEALMCESSSKERFVDISAFQLSCWVETHISSVLP